MLTAFMQAIMSSPTCPNWTIKWFVTDFQELEQVTSGISFFPVLQINSVYAVHTWLPKMQYKIYQLQICLNVPHSMLDIASRNETQVSDI